MSWISQFLVALYVVAAQDPYTLKVEVPVVSVDVTVTDAGDAMVNDLTKNDFQIFEDGVPQEIRFFSPVSAPYNVFLLFDRSGSTQFDWPFMQNAFVKFVEDLRPQDRVALGSFDDGYDVHVPWTGDHAKVIAGLEKVVHGRKGNATRFYSALDRTLRREFRNVVGRRAVVVLTDGKDTEYLWESDGDLKKALKAVSEQRIPVYIVALRDEADSRVILPQTKRYLFDIREFMQQFADRSGGQLLFPKALDDVTAMYERIGRALGTSYSLGYIPSNQTPGGRYRRVEVKTRADGLRLTQSRTGYVGR
jgi:Ca-activated chloride channel homolog